jgi:hypothetical protein
VSGGATIGETVFTYVYIGKYFKISGTVGPEKLKFA